MPNLELATLSVKINADGSQAVKEMKKVGDASTEQKERIETDWKSVGEDLVSVGGKLSLAITTPIVALGTACVNLASDLTETVGKTEVVFGDMADTVMSWSETSVESMGLAQETALNMASTYGDLGTSMGLTTAQASEMSMSLVQLGADMASFKNISIERANIALQAVYTGETESLKAMGIVMTEANLEQFAMAEGCDKTYKAMTQTEKVMLRYRYVMAMTVNAQGDFVRTGDSLANQTRKLGENVKQLGAQFGAILEPAVTKVIASINKAVSWVSNLSDSVKRVVITVAEIVAGIPVLLTAIGGIITIVGKLKTTLALLTANPVIATITAISAGLVALTAIIGNLSDKVDTTSDTYKRFKSSFDEKLKANIDTSDIDALNGKNVNIVIDADTKEALKTAQSLINDLQTNYSGSIAIDGDTTSANEALTELQTAIETAEAFLKMGGNADEAEAVRIGLLEAINKTRGIVGVGANADEINALLDELRTTAIDITASIIPAQDFETTLQGLKDKVEALKGEYTAIGVFEIGENTEENITEYQELLAEATTAITGFDEAVGNLDAIADRMGAEQKASIITKMLTDSMALYTAYQAGVISEEQYNQGMADLATNAQKATKAVDASTEAIKESNKAFNDGKIDTANWGTIYATSMAMPTDATNELTISTEQCASSIEALANGTGSVADAGVAWTAIQQENATNAELVAQAEKKLNDELANNEAELERVTQQETERKNMADGLVNAYERMNDVYGATNDASQALNATLQEYPELARMLIEQTGASVNELNPASASALAYANGNTQLGDACSYVAEQMEAGVSPTEAMVSAMEKFPDVASELPTALNASFETAIECQGDLMDLLTLSNEQVKESNQALEQAQKDYETNTKTAYETWASDMGGITSTYTAQEVATIGAMCQANGLELTGAQIEAQTTATATMEGIVTAVKSGSPSAVNEVHTLVTNMINEADKLEDGGSDSGKNLIEGMISGINNKEGSLYATIRRVVNKSISEAKKAGEIKSPSRKTRDLIGKPFIQGIEVGMENELPNALAKVKTMMGSIISAGSATVNGNYRSQSGNNTTNIARQGNTTINQTNNFTARTLSPYEQQLQLKKMNKQLAEVFV